MTGEKMGSQYELESQLRRLLIGLSDQRIKNGDTFKYDGAALFASDVGDIVLPAALCLADTLSQRLGMGGAGFEFFVGDPNPIFPIAMTQVKKREFFEVAPFLAEVFEGMVYEQRHDLTGLYVMAAHALNLRVDGVVESAPSQPAVGATMPPQASLGSRAYGAVLEQ